MRAEVEALPRAEFEAWLEEEARDQEAGTSSLGLDDPAGIERVVREGRGLMPPVGGDWTDRQMDALTEFLREGGLDGG
jgi:hypothetical protein